jgi:hypothetical protein
LDDARVRAAEGHAQAEAALQADAREQAADERDRAAQERDR